METRITAVLLCALAATASAITIDDGDWQPYISGGTNGVNSEAQSVLITDTGDVIVGGDFTQAGDVLANHIARWDGAAWHALGAGITNTAGATAVAALAQVGTNLYAAGRFTMAGGVAATNIACWNGSAWSALGSGLEGEGVLDLLADGTNLYVAGVISAAGGAPVNGVARWDGSNWHALGSGIPTTGGMGGTFVETMTLYGTNLVVGGDFDVAGGNSVTNLAQWNGTAWSSFAGGIPGYRVVDLEASGTDLYAGGNFSFLTTNAVVAKNVAHWDGSSWHALGSGLDTLPLEMALVDSTLLVVGPFTSAGGISANRIAQWDGSSWATLGSGLNSSASALAVQPVPLRLVVGGDFTTAGTNTCNRIAEANDVTPTWTGASDSSWTNALNWVGEIVPGPLDKAYFGTASNYTVNIVGADAVIDELIINSTNNYVFGGPGTLIPGSGGIRVLQGYHGVGSGIALPTNAGNFHVADGAELSVYTVSITGSGALTKTGTGPLFLSGTHSFSGGVRVVEGKLEVYSDAAFGANNTVELAGGSLGFGSGWSSDRTFLLTASSSMSGYGQLVLNEGLAGTGDLTIPFSGEVFFNGTNTLNGTVIVQDAGVGGTGRLTGNLLIDAGEYIEGESTNVYSGRLLPGNWNAAGTLTVEGDATLKGRYECDFGGWVADRIVVGGSLDLTGGTLRCQIPGGVPNGPYVIASYGSLTGTFAGIENLPHGYTLDYAYNDGISSNNIALVPVVASALLRWPLDEGSGTNTLEAVSGVTDAAHLTGAAVWINGFSPDSDMAVGLTDDTPTSTIDAGTLTTNGTYVAGSDPGYRVLNYRWSITAWIRLPSPQVYGKKVIASSDTTGPAPQTWWDFNVQDVDFNNRNILGFDFGSAGVVSGLSIPLDSRVFVAIVGDISGATVGGGSNRHRFYLWDGDGWQSQAGNPFIPIRLQGLEIGSFNYNLQFNGHIDDVRIFDRSLTQAELDALVTYPTGSYEAYTLGLGLGLNGTNADFDFDYDNDGIPNGYEWATYTSATNPADAVRVTLTDPFDDDYRYINFNRNKYATGISYMIQRTDDLTDPNSWSNQVEYVESEGLWVPFGPIDYEVESNQDTQPILESIGFPVGTNAAAFYRLYMTRP